MLAQVGLQAFSRQPYDDSFFAWWDEIQGASNGLLRHGLDSLLALELGFCGTIGTVVFFMESHLAW